MMGLEIQQQKEIKMNPLFSRCQYCDMFSVDECAMSASPLKHTRV